MKDIIAFILLSVYTTAEFMAYMPQIIQLLRTKSADDISLSSWIIWIISYVCYLIYVLIESPDFGVIFIISLGLFFCIIVTILTAYYKRRKKHEHKHK